ncbi:arginine N-succinyltransferase [Pseudoduganella sp. UC29_71]|uniref:arginine N-succinyltransferase n=1 Tax=Pseudoduganella sp. UC29_71 TaxID=3350174 RepID=UPI00366E6EA2
MNHLDYLLRPATMDDLDVIEKFSRAATFSIRTLKPDRTRLAARVERSLLAFAGSEPLNGDEIYHFVLEDMQAGRVVGTSGIVARAASNGRFYCYRNEFLAHGSEELGISNREHTLRLCEDLSDHTLLSSFFIEPEYSDTLAPQLLSRGRLLFIRNYPHLFAERIGAENPGLCDDEGNSPVWDALGHRFFKMPLPEAEQRTGGRSKSFIAELMPRMPVYVSLLSKEAQWAMGQLHPDAELPFGILVAEGFDVDSYVDIFDGGPIAEARVGMLRSVVSALNVALRGDAGGEGEACLVANMERTAFRATLAHGKFLDDTLQMRRTAIQRLGLAEGGRACAVRLN